MNMNHNVNVEFQIYKDKVIIVGKCNRYYQKQLAQERAKKKYPNLVIVNNVQVDSNTATGYSA